jgi:hypothetical protein
MNTSSAPLVVASSIGLAITRRIRGKVLAHYFKFLSKNHEKLSSGEDIWRFPPDKPTRVVGVTHPKDTLPGRNCSSRPATAQTIVIVSMMTRPD